MNRFLLIAALGIISSCSTSPEQTETVDSIAESEKFQSWEETEKPIGSAASLGLNVYAKVLCSAVFVSERDPEEAFKNSGMIIIEEDLAPHVTYSIDFDQKRAFTYLGDSLSSSASYYGDQGCIIDTPQGLQFNPTPVSSSLAPAEDLDWPLGDKTGPIEDPFQQAIEPGFAPEALTAAMVVVHKGQIIAERYDNGANMNMQLESWSMGKSLTATLIARLIQQGELDMDDPAPISEWQQEGDPRRDIKIRDLLQMSSGLRFSSHRDPVVSVPTALLDHMYVYGGAIDVFDFSVNRPLEFETGTEGRYRNCDPLALGYVLRSKVEEKGGNYYTWPQENLFDKIGIRKQVMETDPYGNFLLTGYDYGTARNWARLGMLYLQDGMWNEERLLPEGFTDFVSNQAPGWNEPVYGGMFWLNGTGQFNLPKDAYYMGGGGGQRTIIVPSLDLVVVRMGHFMGGAHADRTLNEALDALLPLLD